MLHPLTLVLIAPGLIASSDHPLVEDSPAAPANTVFEAFELVAGSQAQTGTLEGRVSEAGTGRALSGAQVYLPGADVGSLTDAQGRYQISDVPAGEVMVRAEMLGYSADARTVVVRDGETVTVDFELRQRALALDEVVVTGMAGEARRREVGSSIAQIRASEVLEPLQDLNQLLTARSPGMNVLRSGASVGQGSQIRLRGNVSVAMSNQPLIYIDGVRLRSDGYPMNWPIGEREAFSANTAASPLNDLNPSDIERIEIVRGPAASAMYGTEAAAGVIQIFTRRGAEGGAQWTAEIQQGFDRVQEFGPPSAPYMRVDPWLRTGHSQRYALSVAGGHEDYNYFLSGSFDDITGVLPVDWEERWAVRANFSMNPRESLRLEWNSSFSTADLRNTPVGNGPYSLPLTAARAPVNYIGSDRKEDIDRLIEEFELLTSIERLVLGITARHQIAQDLDHRFTVGLDRAASDMQNIRPFGWIALPEGAMSTHRWSEHAVTLEYLLNYRQQFSNDLRATFSAGGQGISTTEQNLLGRGHGLPGPGRPTVGNLASSVAWEEDFRIITGGGFLQGLFDYRDRYFLTLGVRVDGNSAFGEDLGLQTYPRASFSYVVSDEDFWPEAIEEFKLRTAYGHAGRAPGAFDAVRTWRADPWVGQSAFVPENVGNAELGPERTEELEVGFDASFLDARVTLETTYYRQNTRDALFSVSQTPSLGFGGSQLENIGLIRNSGIEVDLNATLYRSQALSWDFGFNLATNSSEVVDLGGAPGFGMGGGARIEEGQPVPVLTGTLIRNPHELAEPDLEQDHFFGPNLPSTIIAIRSTFTLPRGVTLSGRGEYQGGHYIQDGFSSGMATRGLSFFCDGAYELLAAGQRDQLTARDRAFCDQNLVSGNMFVWPADFFRLRDVTLSAPLPVPIPGASRSILTLSALNALTWKNSDMLAMDAEMVPRFGINAPVRSISEQIPAPASLIVSIRVQF